MLEREALQPLESRPALLGRHGLRLPQLSLLGLVGLLLTAFILAVVLVGPYVERYAPNAVGNDVLIGPTAKHWFGTDNFGRDYYSRVLGGGRITLWISVASVLLGTAIGVVLGMCSAYFGGLFDLLFQRVIDTMLAVPGLIMAMFFVTLFGRSVVNLITVISLLIIPGIVRVTRATTLQTLTRPYIEAGHVVGASIARILFRHVLPNIAPTIAVIVTTGVGALMLVTAGLGFLGMGVQPPTAEWGRMLSEGRGYAVTAPWLAVFPGLLISVTVVGVNLLGDAMRDKWDPSLRQ